MSLLQQINQKAAEARKPFTTVIQVDRIEPNRDPSKATLIGKDIFNKDENGVPREVTVKQWSKNQNNGYRTLNNFANKSDLVHTEPGGLIRIDRAIKKNDTTYVCQHLQRIAQDASMVRMDQGGSQHKHGVIRAWTKVYPTTEQDQNGRRSIKTFMPKREGGAPIHRAKVRAIPEDNKPAKLVAGSPEFTKTLESMIDKAIQQAPEKTRPFLMLRDVGKDAKGKEQVQVKEIAVSRFYNDESGKLQTRSDDEIKDIFMKHDLIAHLVIAHQALSQQGQTAELSINAGFEMETYGRTVGDDGKPTKSRVESMANDTARHFKNPESDTNPEAAQYIRGRQEYALGVLDYQIPMDDDRTNVVANGFGRDSGVTASPDAGMSVTPNPFYENQQPTQAAAQSQAASQPAPAAAEQRQAPAPAQPESAPAAPAATAAAAAPAAQAPAQPSPAAMAQGPENPEALSDDDIDAMLMDNDLDGLDFDDELNTIESQLQGQGM